ncbi:glycoside hydrolase family 3 N-terminal domain-containing protein [Draconibacterium sp. IB214405]|uniref:glycoside hydrolase family 3 N-terminal domain-containing protein n=1 Tax=Draconibacterium sp. IB214405 TaxID=3097352 RepID=UPI002A0B27D7|nr:glycoside hydrolase family 3 N-terminal domain-containing protein [Draconibacterium sp. IB214405]MDX8340016.1 glycoside hydrolase family 3 N-terminal domain-containing protein [Draconibacterium sp. IB214405]
MWFRILFCLLLISSIVSAQPTNPVYQDAKYSVEERTQDLLNRMTLDEKLGQLLCPMGWEMYEKNSSEVTVSETFKNMQKEKQPGMYWATFRADPWTQKTLKTGLSPEQAAEAANALQQYMIDNSRLGIPIFLAEEAAHGHMAIGTTVFPTSLGQAATFNTALMEEMGQAIAAEISAQGAHIAYGPILDLARDPRWSRVEETFGEDPILIAQMGSAMVKGLGGGDLKQANSVISTLKHFVAYGVPESGINGNASIVSRRDLLENYFPPFKAAIDAGALSVMTSYNSIDGLPSTMNKEYLTDILREDWHFSGFTVSDLFSIEGIAGSHRIVKTAEEAALKSIVAGTNVDLGGQAYARLKNAVQQGLLDESIIDSAVSNVIRLKFEMGLFDSPFVDPGKAEKIVHNDAHIELARKMAQQSTVLLENKGATLPLPKKDIKVAVVGPNADMIYNQLGDYTAPQPAESVVTVYEGLVNKLGAKNVIYEKGCAIRDTTQSNIPAAVKAAENADVVVVVVGGSSARDFSTDYQETGAAIANSEVLSDMESGEGNDRSTLMLMGDQMKLLEAIKKTGKPMVVIYIEGRPLNMNWAAENADALLTAWYPGEQGGNGIADVLFGDYNPSGRLPVSIAASVGQLPNYYNKKNPKAHNYVEGSSAPLYAFGAGKSYTSFSYQNMTTERKDKYSYTVSFDLKNTGDYDGTEVVQLYLRDEYASTVRPIKQLIDFKQVVLKKGETKRIAFTVGEEQLSMIDANYERVVEAGDFKLMIGAASDDIRLQETITID